MARDIQALVIGNGAYSETLRLSCPANDATAVADCLRNSGINVIIGIDLSYDELNKIVDQFIDKVNLPTTTVSLLYYSGHGWQLNDQNYLVPVDFNRYATNNITKLVSVQGIVDRMSNASAVRIVMLDACRNNGQAREFI
jgi:uncharacterized caspase-like protein